MCDALQELPELSIDIQKRDMDIYRASNLSKYFLRKPQDICSKETATWYRCRFTEMGPQLDPKHWPDDVDSHLTFGGKEVTDLSRRLRVNERQMICAFREYLVGRDSQKN
jgi:hypothetical protein